jgi:hypothetical protein
LGSSRHVSWVGVARRTGSTGHYGPKGMCNLRFRTNVQSVGNHESGLDTSLSNGDGWPAWSRRVGWSVAAGSPIERSCESASSAAGSRGRVAHAAGRHGGSPRRSREAARHCRRRRPTSVGRTKVSDTVVEGRQLPRRSPRDGLSSRGVVAGIRVSAGPRMASKTSTVNDGAAQRDHRICQCGYFRSKRC